MGQTGGKTAGETPRNRSQVMLAAKSQGKKPGTVRAFPTISASIKRIYIKSAHTIRAGLSGAARKAGAARGAH